LSILLGDITSSSKQNSSSIPNSRSNNNRDSIILVFTLDSICSEALFPNNERITLEDLKEFDLKIINIPKIKLTLNLWFILSRILWLLGLNKTQNSIHKEKKRVEKLIPTLLQQDCCIVGHGFIQHEIKKYLRKYHFVKSFHEKNGCFCVEIFQNPTYKQNSSL